MELEQAVAVVTGASSGIGAATARLLAEQGARVVLVARRANRLAQLAAQLPGAIAVPTDVTVASQVEDMLALTTDLCGGVDILVNNAGQGLHLPVEQLDPADLRAVFELNVVAPLVAMKAVLPRMRRRGRGAIVNISSATSLRGFAGLGGYTATKAALNALSEAARLELQGAGVSVSVVYPTLTATEFHRHLRSTYRLGMPAPHGADPPEYAARAVRYAIETGEPHVLVGETPTPIAFGGDDLDPQRRGLVQSAPADRRSNRSDRDGETPGAAVS